MEEIDFDNDHWDPLANQKFINENSEFDRVDSDKEQSHQLNRYRRSLFFTPPEDSREIWTDGGSRKIKTADGKDSYVSAWAFYDKQSDTLKGEAGNGTNNQMELTACIKALEYIDSLGYPKNQWITIHLDSDYVRVGILYRVSRWIAQKWKRFDEHGNEVDVKNIDLWKRLYELSTGRKIFWKHVKGHSGDEGNEKVDTKCGLLMDEQMKK